MRSLCAIAVLALGCQDRAAGTARPLPSARPEASAPPAPSAAPQLAPLGGAWLERIEAEPGKVSVVTVPLGAREPRPILVAVHGGGDRPDWACGGWRIAAEAYPFVVCPEGSASGGGRFAWPSSQAIWSAIEAALPALRARFPGYVADGPMIYAGFSQGATLAEPILLAHPAEFPVAILAEGGYQTLMNADFAKKYVARGGSRLMIVCGTPGCRTHATRAEALLRGAGLDVISSGDPSSGHNLNEPMQRALRADWPALAQGVQGWAAYPRYRWPQSGTVN
jgi:predicted esterase